MTDPLEDTHALRAEEVTGLTGAAEEQDETGTPEEVAETEDAMPIESSEQLASGAPQPFVPADEAHRASSGAPSAEMYSTEEERADSAEPGDFERDQEPADREPRPGNVASPGQRPSE